MKGERAVSRHSFPRLIGPGFFLEKCTLKCLTVRRQTMIGILGLLLWSLMGHECLAQEIVPSVVAEVTTIDGSTRREVDRLLRHWKALSRDTDAADPGGEDLLRDVAALRRWSESTSRELVLTTENRFLPLPRYAAVLLSQAPEVVLQTYRRQVDPIARPLLEREDRDFSSYKTTLLRLVRRYPCSTPAEEAFWKLGEMAVADGEPARARSYWECLVPPAKEPEMGSRSYFVYPRPRVSRSEVLGRLAFLSILEGDRARARREIEVLRRQYPEASGQLAGETVVWEEVLGKWLRESARWHPPQMPSGWPTFAGSTKRGRVVEHLAPPEKLLWHKTFAEDSTPVQGLVVWKTHVFVQTGNEVCGYRLPGGEPCWTDDGVLYREEEHLEEIVPLAAPLAVHGDRLYAVFVGRTASGRWSSRMVCLDLSAEGRLVWHVTPEREGVYVGGAPVVCRDRVIAAEYSSGNGWGASLVARDAVSGHRRWSTSLGSVPVASPESSNAETRSIVQGLPTLAEGRVYLNSNLGILASIEAETGELRWLRTDVGTSPGEMEPPARLRPFPAPCLFHRGMLYVAPHRSERVFALDASRGLLKWKTGPETRWIDRLLAVVPSAEPSPRLLGAGDRVYWIETRGADSGTVVRAMPSSAFRLPAGQGVVGRPGMLLGQSQRLWWIPMNGVDRAENRLMPTMMPGPVEWIPGPEGTVLGRGPDSLLLWTTLPAGDQEVP